MSKKEIWKFVVQSLLAILTALGTALGVSSCIVGLQRKTKNGDSSDDCDNKNGPLLKELTSADRAQGHHTEEKTRADSDTKYRIGPFCFFYHISILKKTEGCTDLVTPTDELTN